MTPSPSPLNTPRGVAVRTNWAGAGVSSGPLVRMMSNSDQPKRMISFEGAPLVRMASNTSIDSSSFGRGMIDMNTFELDNLDASALVASTPSPVRRNRSYTEALETVESGPATPEGKQ